MRSGLSMRVSGGIFGLLAITGCLLLATAAQAQSTSLDEIRAKVDAGQYQDALKLIAPALTKVRADDKTGERYQLLALRGECLLHIGQYATAAGMFDTAAKAAPDVKSSATARASALLVRGSPGGKYTSKGADKTPIDIVDAQSRKKAFAAMRTDRFTSAKPRIDASIAGDSIQPMMELLPQVMDIGYLEFAAAGEAGETKQTLMDFGAHARALFLGELKRIHRQIDVLEDASNATDNYTRRGLYSNERNGLMDDVAYLQKIAQTCRDGRRRAMELGFDGAAWEPIIADAEDLIDSAQALLNVQ